MTEMSVNKKATLMAVVAFCLVSGAASAANCELHVTRTACPGQEVESYKKCNGQQSCDNVIQAADEAQCKAEATKACENQRLDITKLKVITAKFNGKALAASNGGSDFCMVYEKRAAEFDKCKK
jgi:hypothetical protein